MYFEHGRSYVDLDFPCPWFVAPLPPSHSNSQWNPNLRQRRKKRIAPKDPPPFTLPPPALTDFDQYTARTCTIHRRPPSQSTCDCEFCVSGKRLNFYVHENSVVLTSNRKRKRKQNPELPSLPGYVGLDGIPFRCTLTVQDLIKQATRHTGIFWKYLEMAFLDDFNLPRWVEDCAQLDDLLVTFCDAFPNDVALLLTSGMET